MPLTTPIASRMIATPIFDRTDGKTRSYAGEEIEDLADAGGFTDSLGLRLALFAGKQTAKPFLAGENLLAGLLQDGMVLEDPGA